MKISRKIRFYNILLCLVIFLSTGNLSRASAKVEDAPQLSTSKILSVPYIDQVYVQQKIQSQDPKWKDPIWYLCGPSSTNMALAYFGYTKGDVGSTKSVARNILVNPLTARYTDWTKIKPYLQNTFGIKTTFRSDAKTQLTFSKIKQQIDSGRPILLGISFYSSIDRKTIGHISIIVGYAEPNIVILDDPYGGKIVKNGNGYYWAKRNTPPGSSPKGTGNKVQYKYEELQKFFKGYWLTFDSVPGTKNPPVLVSPQSDSQLNTANIDFKWNPVNDAKEYLLEYSGPSSGGSDWMGATSFSIADLPAGDYSWHVKARNISGESSWSPSWSFSILLPSPEAPALISPIDTEIVPSTFSFTWNTTTNATEYFLEYSGTSSGNSGWVSETSFPVTSLPAGNYTWHVKARNNGGESAWSETRNFTVQSVLHLPDIPILVSPAEGAMATPDVAFLWNTVVDATEYYAEYSGTSSGNSGWTSNTNFVVSSLPDGNYTWRVKARNGDGEGQWSSPSNFTVQSTSNPIIAPTLSSPTDAQITGTSPELHWTASPDATEYFAEYSGAMTGNSGWIANTTLTVDSLAAGTYTWHVKARNATSESDWSQSWSFTVIPSPTVPTLTSPSDHTTIVGSGLSLTWDSIAGATGYYAEYAGPASGNSDWINATSFSIASLPAGTYTWRVKAKNTGGESAWSPIRTFTLQAIPSTVSINSPTAISPTGACSTSNWMTFTNNLSHTVYLTQNNNVNPWSPNPNYAYWKSTIPLNGYYKIEAYIPSHGTFYWCGSGGAAKSVNTNDAHYQIYTSTGWKNVEKSQNIGGNVWLNLGEFYLTSGNYNIVKLIDSNHATSYSQLIFFSDIRITWVRQ